MWVKTKSGEFVNLDNVSHITIGDDDTIGGQRTKCLHAHAWNTRIRMTNPGPAVAPHEKALERVMDALSAGIVTTLFLD